ncbi:MAG: WD40 repeat domain-containing protein [Planctomycetota bacterium]
MVALGSDSHEVRVLELAGREIASFRASHPRVYKVFFLTDPLRIAALSSDRFDITKGQKPTTAACLEIWDIGSATRKSVIVVPGWSYIGAAITPDQSAALVWAVVGTRGVIKAFDTVTGRELRELQGFTPLSIAGTTASPDGKMAVANVGGSLHTWDLRTGDLLSTARGHLLTVAFHLDPPIAVLSTMDGMTARIVDIASGKTSATVAFGRTPAAAAVGASGGVLAMGGGDGEVLIYQLPDLLTIGRLKASGSVREILFGNEELLVVSDEPCGPHAGGVNIQAWAIPVSSENMSRMDAPQNQPTDDDPVPDAPAPPPSDGD